MRQKVAKLWSLRSIETSKCARAPTFYAAVDFSLLEGMLVNLNAVTVCFVFIITFLSATPLFSIQVSAISFASIFQLHAQHISSLRFSMPLFQLLIQHLTQHNVCCFSWLSSFVFLAYFPLQWMLLVSVLLNPKLCMLLFIKCVHFICSKSHNCLLNTKSQPK